MRGVGLALAILLSGPSRAQTGADDLAAALIRADSDGERQKLLHAHREIAPSALVDALNQRSRRFWESSEYSKAEATYRLSLRLAEEAGYVRGRAAAIDGSGVVHHLRGDHERAIPLHREALALYESIGHPAGMAECLSNLGLNQYARGDYDGAIEFHTKALQLREQVGERPKIARSLVNLGNVFYVRGNYRAALSYYQRALPVFEAAKDHWSAAATLNNIGLILADQGNPTQALAYHERVLSLRRQLGDSHRIAGTLNNIGNVYYDLEKFTRSIEHYELSRALHEKVGDQDGVARALQNIGGVHRRRGDYARALANFQRSLRLREEVGDKEGITLCRVEIAGVYQAQGKPRLALDWAKQSAALAAELGLRESLWQAQYRMARAHMSLGESQPAREALEQAISTIESLRTDAAGAEQHQQRFLAGRIDPYHAMVQLLAGQNAHTEALQYMERTKSRLLMDLLRAGRAEIQHALTRDERDEDKQWRVRLALARGKGRREQDEVRKQYEAFRLSLMGRHPEICIETGDLQPLSLEESMRLIPGNDGAILEYEVTDDKTYVFTLTRKEGLRAAAISISRNDLARRLGAFRDQLASRDLEADATGPALFNLLIGPVRKNLAGKTKIVVVPDDVLWEIPFCALKLSPSRYWQQEAAISYAPSLAALAEMGKRARSNTMKSALVLGDPNGNLGHAADEARAVARLYEANAFAGGEASEQRIKAEGPDAGVLHLATHGVLENANPLYSYLRLAASGSEDGFLEAREILELSLKADLVVLSACETARGRFGAGEGVIGLTWALFAAGSPAAVVSQWKVDSASTTELMVAFHRRLRGGAGKAEALRGAALDLMRNPQYRHPFYWAAFALNGAGF